MINNSVRNNVNLLEICLLYNKEENFYFDCFLKHIKELNLNIRTNLINFYSIFGEFQITEQDFNTVKKSKILINFEEKLNKEDYLKIKDVFEIRETFIYIFKESIDEGFFVKIADDCDKNDNLLVKIKNEEVIEKIIKDEVSFNINNEDFMIFKFLLKNSEYSCFIIEKANEVLMLNFIEEREYKRKKIDEIIENFISCVLSFLNLETAKKKGIEINFKEKFGAFLKEKNTDDNKQKNALGVENIIEKKATKDINELYPEGTRFEVLLSFEGGIKIENFVNFIKDEFIKNERLEEIFLIQILNENNLELYPHELFWHRNFTKIRAIFYNAKNNRISLENVKEIVNKIESCYKVFSINFL